jgi:pilus assembly protein CpaE
MGRETNHFKVLIGSADETLNRDLAESLGRHSSHPEVTTAIGGEQALAHAQECHPDVALIAVDLGTEDGFETVRRIVSGVPGVSCLLLSPAPDHEQYRKALQVGARDLLAIPLPQNELFAAIEAAWAVTQQKRSVLDGISARADEPHRGKGVVVFSTKGGTGKTFLSVNLAAGLASAGKRVALVDLDLQFGDAAIALGLVPQRTVYDLVRGYTDFDLTLMRDFMVTHRSGLQLLPAPLYPDEAEQITVEDVEKILEVLSAGFDYVIVDTPPFFEERVLAALDWADHIISVGSMDLPTIKNLKIGFTMMNLLAFPEDKLWIVMNRADSRVGLETSEAEKHLGMKVRYTIPSSIEVPKALNSGESLLLTKPKSQVSQQLVQIVQKLSANGNSNGGANAKPDAKRRSRLFRR